MATCRSLPTIEFDFFISTIRLELVVASKQASRTARFPGPFYKMRQAARKMANADIDIRTIQATLKELYNRTIARRTLRRWLEGTEVAGRAARPNHIPGH